MKMQSSVAVVLLAIATVASGLPFLDIIDPMKTLDSLPKKFGIQRQWQSKDTSLCSYNTFRQQFEEFVRGTGVQAGNYTNNIAALINGINAQLQQAIGFDAPHGRETLAQICGAQRSFFSAIGLQNWLNCLMASTLVANQWDRTNGYQAVMLFRRLNYQCGSAYQTYYRRIDLFAAMTNQATNLQNCTDKFIQDLSASQGQIEPCENMEEYDECVGRVYGLATGSDSDVAFTTCEASRIGNIVTLPRCTDDTWACHVKHILS